MAELEQNEIMEAIKRLEEMINREDEERGMLTEKVDSFGQIQPATNSELIGKMEQIPSVIMSPT